MDYFLTEEQEMIVDIARQITDEQIIPNRAELDEKDEFPRDILKSIGQADLFGVPIPEEYGGFGGGCLDIWLPDRYNLQVFLCKHSPVTL